MFGPVGCRREALYTVTHPSCRAKAYNGFHHVIQYLGAHRILPNVAMLVKIAFHSFFHCCNSFFNSVEQGGWTFSCIQTCLDVVSYPTTSYTLYNLWFKAATRHDPFHNQQISCQVGRPCLVQSSSFSYHSSCRYICNYPILTAWWFFPPKLETRPGSIFFYEPETKRLHSRCKYFIASANCLPPLSIICLLLQQLVEIVGKQALL